MSANFNLLAQDQFAWLLKQVPENAMYAIHSHIKNAQELNLDLFNTAKAA